MRTAVETVALLFAAACLPESVGQPGAPGAEEIADGQCGAWHPDEDGDGFGDEAVSWWGCDPLPGWVLDASDCYDGNADTNPDQDQFFVVHRGDGSYDYDCDGDVTYEHEDRGGCLLSAPVCVPDPGWRHGLPECGRSDEYFIDCYAPEAGSHCQSAIETRIQGCR